MTTVTCEVQCGTNPDWEIIHVNEVVTRPNPYIRIRCIKCKQPLVPVPRSSWGSRLMYLRHYKKQSCKQEYQMNLVKFRKCECLSCGHAWKGLVILSTPADITKISCPECSSNTVRVLKDE